MKLTHASSYALHAVAYMAQQKNVDKPVASHKIAEDRDIPERFLLKVLKPLVTARVLLSIKGPNGGYRLARPASDINMLEIVEAVDGTIKGEVPPPEKWRGTGAVPKPLPRSMINTLSPLQSKLDGICRQTAEQTRKQLEKVKLSELLKK